MMRLIARREACDSMSSTTGLSPAASARPWRSCTRSLRDAAISTSTSPTEVRLGPMTQKSRLTSSSEKGMYWLASVSTWTSSSSSRRPAGSIIFFVITADCGIAMTTSLVRVPLLPTTRRTASATSSNFSIWPSVIQPFSKLSEAKRSTTYSPEADCSSSTSLTLEELMSSPIIGGCLRPINTSRKLTSLFSQRATACAGLLRSYFNASSKAFDQHRGFPA